MWAAVAGVAGLLVVVTSLLGWPSFVVLTCLVVLVGAVGAVIVSYLRTVHTRVHRVAAVVSQIESRLTSDDAHPPAAAPSVGTDELLHMRDELIDLRHSVNECRSALVRSTAEVSSRPRVLMVSSNGSGLGHLTRLMAIAEASDADTEFLTMSTGHRLVSARGHRVTYFPSAAASGFQSPVWNEELAAFLRRFLDARHFDLVVFDGTWLYPGITNACRMANTRLVWVQRGNWKKRKDRASLQRHAASRVCDAVIVPGDYAVSEMVGLGPRIESLHVNPITLIGRKDVLDRATALRELGLNDRRHVLVQLGAGNVNDTTDLRSSAIAAVRALGPDWEPVVVASPIADRDDGVASDATVVRAYPVARHFRAFEFVIGASGYNLVQEAAGLGLPAVLVPNLATKTDAQGNRARGAANLGVAVVADGVDDIAGAVACVARDLDAMREAAAVLPEPSGATEAAQFLQDFLSRHAALRSHVRSIMEDLG